MYPSCTELMFINISESFTINGKTEYRSSSKIHPSKIFSGFGGAILYYGEAFIMSFDFYQSYYLLQYWLMQTELHVII